MKLPSGISNSLADKFDVKVLSKEEVTGFHQDHILYETFDLSFVRDYQLVEGALDFVFTISYQLTEVSGSLRDKVKLFYQDGQTWKSALCPGHNSSISNDTIFFPVCHLSRFGIAANNTQIVPTTQIQESTAFGNATTSPSSPWNNQEDLPSIQGKEVTVEIDW